MPGVTVQKIITQLSLAKKLRDTVAKAPNTYKINEKNVKFKDIVILKRSDRKKKIANLANDCILSLASSYKINLIQIIYMTENAVKEIEQKIGSQKYSEINKAISENPVSMREKLLGNEDLLSYEKNDISILDNIIIYSMVNKNIEIWNKLCNDCKENYITRDFEAVKHFVTSGKFKESDILSSLSEIKSSNESQKENQKFTEKIIDYKEKIVEFLKKFSIETKSGVPVEYLKAVQTIAGKWIKSLKYISFNEKEITLNNFRDKIKCFLSQFSTSFRYLPELCKSNNVASLVEKYNIENSEFKNFVWKSSVSGVSIDQSPYEKYMVSINYAYSVLQKIMGVEETLSSLICLSNSEIYNFSECIPNTAAPDLKRSFSRLADCVSKYHDKYFQFIKGTDNLMLDLSIKPIIGYGLVRTTLNNVVATVRKVCEFLGKIADKKIVLK